MEISSFADYSRGPLNGNDVINIVFSCQSTALPQLHCLLALTKTKPIVPK